MYDCKVPCNYGSLITPVVILHNRSHAFTNMGKEGLRRAERQKSIDSEALNQIPIDLTNENFTHCSQCLRVLRVYLPCASNFNGCGQSTNEAPGSGDIQSPTDNFESLLGMAKSLPTSVSSLFGRLSHRFLHKLHTGAQRWGGPCLLSGRGQLRLYHICWSQSPIALIQTTAPGQPFGKGGFPLLQLSF